MVQSTMNISEPTTTSETSDHEINFEEPCDEDHLVPFREECLAHVVQSLGADGPLTVLRCTLPSGLTYPIPSVGEKWIKEQMILGELISDETIMTLPADAMLNQYTHEIHMSDLPRLWNYEMEERERRRKLRRLATTGTKTVLAVRVQATDATTTPTATDLQNLVFNDNGNNFNLKYQTEACSANQLIINKAADRAGTSTSISGGVTLVTISVATSAGSTAVENAITVALNTEFSVTNPNSLADHVMYCFPPGTTTSLAYAVVNGYQSFYNDLGCTYGSAQMHEIG